MQSKPNTILILGEGNFSFALAYAKQVSPSTTRIVATSYDSQAQVVTKYPESRDILTTLQSLPHVAIYHEIDASKLEQATVLSQYQFSVIRFNHPHCGVEDVLRHQAFLSHCFHSIKAIADPKTTRMVIVLTSDQPERWQLLERAKKQQFFHVSTSIFDDDKYPGYQRKRHQNGQSFHRVLLHGSLIEQHSREFEFTLKKPLETNTQTLKRKAEDVEPSQWHCQECDKSFHTAQGHRTHMHMVHELQATAKKRKVECVECARTFKSEDAYNQHRKAKHGQDPKIQPDWIHAKEQQATAKEAAKTCDICDFKFPTQEAYEQHQVDLEPTAAQIAQQCSKCAKTFQDQRALRQHANFCSL